MTKKIKEFPPFYYEYEDDEGKTFSAHFQLAGELINLYCFTIDELFESYTDTMERYLDGRPYLNIMPPPFLDEYVVIKNILI